MKKVLLFFVASLFVLSACIPTHHVGYFETNPNVYSPSKKSEQNISINLRLAVEDSFKIEYDGLPKTAVIDFRRSVASGLSNTFKESFNSIMWLNGFNPEGISLVFTKISPNWYSRAESSMGTEYGCEIDYGVIIYINGSMQNEIRKKAKSVVGGQRPMHAVDLLRNALKVMCEEAYLDLQKERDKVAGSSGTGFLISSNGYILTNSHVIEGARSITIKGIGGDFSNSHDAKLVIEDKPNDLALLKIESKIDTTLPYPIRFKGVETGEDAFVLGYPLISAMGEEIKLTKGIVSSKSGYQGSTSSYQISAQVQPGNSGSPVFDNNGNLIGVVNSKIMGAEGVTYVIKPSFIRALFDNADIQLLMPEKNNLEKLSLSEKTKLVSPFIYIVKVER